METESPKETLRPNFARGFLHFLKWAALVCGVLFVAAYGYYRYKFPYGYSHCCIVQITLSFREYAEEHGGKYPVGEKTPEASLCLLGKAGMLGPNPAYILRGKTVPLSIAERAWKKDGTLGPDTCGWHYVEGLSEDDGPDIALVWDKVGLGHNGERFEGGGHEVGYADGSHRYILAAKWSEFLEEQKRLLAARRR